MHRLLAGYRRFREEGWPEQRRAFESLAKHGQKPKAMVLACVDSRVDPAMIFDTAPGEVLTVRNVANLVPPYAPDAAYHGTSAALEFGVNALEVEDDRRLLLEPVGDLLSVVEAAWCDEMHLVLAGIGNCLDARAPGRCCCGVAHGSWWGRESA